MKLKTRLWTILSLLGILISGACEKGDQLEEGGFWGVSAPETILNSGELITIRFEAAGPWEVEPVTSDGGSWATVRSTIHNTSAGSGTVRISVDANNGEGRQLDVYITVSGYSRSLLCSLTQGEGSGEMNTYLNTRMHEILSAKYLWNEKYNELYQQGSIDMSQRWDNFLYANLTKLGETNIEDGGYYREYSSMSGQRYIYSYIEETGSSAGLMTKAAMTSLGIGPTMSSRLYNDGSQVGLIIGYVYIDSPAYIAGLRRGDIIYSVNGTELNLGNYSIYQQELYYNASGTYNLGYYRYQDDKKGGITMVGNSVTVSSGSFDYNPVLLVNVYKDSEFESDGQTYDLNIGYLVLEAFDLTGMEYYRHALQQLKDQGIKDLILDLRFSPGGSVPVCRYIMTSIVGQAHYNYIFSKMKFNDGSIETWTFGNGSDKTAPDALGTAPDLGLNRLFVICSENTASAAEMVINSLRGIDFPVYLFGSKTEGKNVGMTTETITYRDRTFEFAPITFYVMNAKDEGDYADGMGVDYMVNNQDAANVDDHEPFFPYVAIDWETTLNLEIDKALNWAFYRCLMDKDPEWVTESTDDSGTSILSKSTVVENRKVGDILSSKIESTPLKKIPGRFGSVIPSGK